jgi:DNA-binding transcriptional LysR family regulator
VPVSTVSRRIARLEARLGVGLLTRSTRKLALTEAGGLFHAHAVRAVAELEAAEQLVRDLGTRPRGRIRITAPHGVAGLLWPVIAEFLAKHPDVSVELDAHERRVNLIEERYDLTIATGPLADSSLIARKILEGSYGLYASASYLRKRGRPRQLSELAEHDCVLSGPPEQRSSWRLRMRQQTRRVRIHGRAAFNEVGLAHRAALDGLGIARLPAAMVALDLRAGRLERVLPGVDGGPTPAFIAYPATRVLSAGMRALIDHLIERLPVAYAHLKS